METNENYYLVQYSDSYGGRVNEGVFTKKGWENYIKEENKDREEEDKWKETMEECEELGQFIFTEIKVYN